MIQRIYIDTSVIGGCFDIEFKEWSNLLFEEFRKGKLKIIYSEITIDELEDAPQHVKDLLHSIKDNHKEYVTITDEVLILAETYIKEKVVGKTSRADCIHIALATINKVDILVSWNFKHIVNINRIRGYNSVNLRLGYQTLEIRTPKEIL
jgi:predicted nucleic acid-binding protein